MPRHVRDIDGEASFGEAPDMKYPRECVSRLLQEIRSNDALDPPGSKYAEHNDEARALHFPHPSPAVLEQLLDVAYAASLQPEEGRLPQFALAYVSPEGPGRHYKACTFSVSKELSTRTVAKLAPATDPSRTYFGVWQTPGSESLQVWGLIHSQKESLSTAPEDGRSGFLWRGPFLIVRVHGPGVFLVYHCTRLLLAYARGKASYALPPTRLLDVLRDRASLDPEQANAVCNVVDRMVVLGTGGTVLITDPELNVASTLLDLSYPFTQPNTILKDAESDYRTNSHAEKWKEPLRLALDFVAQMSRVDGVVHMTSDLAIRGFGGKVMMAAPDGSVFTTEEPSETSDSGPGLPQPLSLATLTGMRHRSAAAFCANQPGQALAIVVSQDGDVSLFGRRDDGTVHRIGPFALGIGLSV